MSSLPGQLSATAPAFVPTSNTKTPRLVQRRRPRPGAGQPQSSAKPQDTARSTASALFVADKIWAPTQSSQSNWAVPPATTKACAPAADRVTRPRASYANALQVDPAQKLAASLGLIRPSTQADGRWQAFDAKEEAVITQVSTLLQTMGEPNAKRFLSTAKILLSQTALAADVVQAIELMLATAPEHREPLARLCYRMSSSGVSDRDSRLKMAGQISAYPIEQVRLADLRLSHLYRTAGLHPLASSDHWTLCKGLMSLGAAAESLDEKCAGPNAYDRSIWTGVLQQWLKYAPSRWLEQLECANANVLRGQQAHRLLVSVCGAHRVCLPLSLEPLLAGYLADHEDDATLATQTLQTAARLLPPKPADTAALRLWQVLTPLSGPDQTQLLAMVEAIYPRVSADDAKLDAIELLCAQPAAAAYKAHTILQTLYSKANTTVTPSYQLKLIVGLAALKTDMAALQSICLEPELDAESVAGLLVHLIELDPSAWLDEAQARLLTAQEFVTVNIKDVPNATVCGQREDAKRQYRTFSVF